MQVYPTHFPADAAQVVFNVATHGFAPDGEHGDVACFVQALWNIQGYGLSLWKPHDHVLKAGEAPKPMKFGRWTAPKTEKAQINALVKALEPARSLAMAAPKAESPVAAEANESGGETPKPNELEQKKGAGAAPAATVAGTTAEEPEDAEETQEAAAGAEAGAIDWSKIPWEQVIMLVTVLVQSLLRKEKK
jgi:hypothetical protein